MLLNPLIHMLLPLLQNLFRRLQQLLHGLKLRPPQIPLLRLHLVFLL